MAALGFIFSQNSKVTVQISLNKGDLGNKKKMEVER